MCVCADANGSHASPCSFAVRAEVCDVGREIIRRFHTMRLTMMSEGWVVMTGRTVYSGAARVCFKQRNGTPLSGGLLWPVDERGPQEQLALAIGTWQAEALISGIAGASHRATSCPCPNTTKTTSSRVRRCSWVPGSHGDVKCR